MESKGGGSGGSDGGRGSYGGEREWCRVMERGSSPGLIVAHVCSSLPTSAPCFPCLRMIACVCVSLPMSMHCCLCLCIIACVHTLLPVSACHCPCPCVIACVCASLPTSIHIRGWLFLFTSSRLCLWLVSFVCGHGW